MPGYGTDARFDADFAYHFGIAKPILAAINGPAAGRRPRARLLLRRAAGRGRAPSSRPRTAASGCPPSSGCRGCSRGSSAPRAPRTCCSRAACSSPRRPHEMGLVARVVAPDGARRRRRRLRRRARDARRAVVARGDQAPALRRPAPRRAPSRSPSPTACCARWCRARSSKRASPRCASEATAGVLSAGSVRRSPLLHCPRS